MASCLIAYKMSGQNEEDKQPIEMSHEFGSRMEHGGSLRNYFYSMWWKTIDKIKKVCGLRVPEDIGGGASKSFAGSGKTSERSWRVWRSIATRFAGDVLKYLSKDFLNLQTVVHNIRGCETSRWFENCEEICVFVMI